MSRNTELYKKASEAIPGEDDRNFALRQIRNGWCMGYEQGEKDTVKKAIEWLEYAKESGMTFDGTIKYFKAIMEDEK